MNIPKYSTRVQWSDEDECYVALCPEVDGCSGFGATAQEATDDLMVALEMTITVLAEKGMKFPDPITLEECSGQWRQRAPKDLHAWLIQEAADQGVSMNTLVVSLLQHSRGQADAFAGTKHELERMIMLLTTSRNVSVSVVDSTNAAWTSPNSTQNDAPTNVYAFNNSQNTSSSVAMEN